MNRVTSEGTKPRPLARSGLLNWLNQVSRLNQFCEKVYHRIPIKRQPLIRFILNQPIPQSGITTAVRNLCSSGARSKKAMLLDVVKDRPPVRQPVDGAGNGDSKGHLVSSGIPVRRKGVGIPLINKGAI